MWEVHATGWLRRRFRVEEEGRVLTELRSRWGREEAQFSLGARVYTVARESRWAGQFCLESEGKILARATKPSAFQRRFVLLAGAEEYELAARGVFSSAFDLSQGAREIGSVERLSVWGRGAVVALPEQMDPAIRVFVLWLVLTMWERADSAAT